MQVKNKRLCCAQTFVFNASYNEQIVLRKQNEGKRQLAICEYQTANKSFCVSKINTSEARGFVSEKVQRANHFAQAKRK